MPANSLNTVLPKSERINMPWTYPKAATCIISKLMENTIGKYSTVYRIHFGFLFIFSQILRLIKSNLFLQFLIGKNDDRDNL